MEHSIALVTGTTSGPPLQSSRFLAFNRTNLGQEIAHG